MYLLYIFPTNKRCERFAFVQSIRITSDVCQSGKAVSRAFVDFDGGARVFILESLMALANRAGEFAKLLWVIWIIGHERKGFERRLLFTWLLCHNFRKNPISLPRSERIERLHKLPFHTTASIHFLPTHFARQIVYLCKRINPLGSLLPENYYFPYFHF